MNETPIKDKMNAMLDNLYVKDNKIKDLIIKSIYNNGTSLVILFKDNLYCYFEIESDRIAEMEYLENKRITVEDVDSDILNLFFNEEQIKEFRSERDLVFSKMVELQEKENLRRLKRKYEN